MTRWLTLLLLATSSMAQSPLPHFSIENPEATLKDAFVEQRRLVKQEIKQIGGFKGGAVSANAKKWFKSDRPLSGVLPKSGNVPVDLWIGLSGETSQYSLPDMLPRMGVWLVRVP